MKMITRATFRYDNTQVHAEYLTAALNGFTDHAGGGAMSVNIDHEPDEEMEQTLDVVRSHPQGLDKIRQAPKELAILFQEYLDDSSVESDNFLTGLDVSQTAAVELFNDFLLFVNGGVTPPLTVKDPSESELRQEQYQEGQQALIRGHDEEQAMIDKDMNEPRFVSGPICHGGFVGDPN